MRSSFLIFFLIFLINTGHSQSLQVWNDALEEKALDDWLITPMKSHAAVYQSKDGKDIILSNGLVKRSFRISPNTVCIDFKNLSNGQQLLRAVKPEARIIINGIICNVGGLYGQKENAYLIPGWLDGLTAHDSDFHYTGHQVNDIKPYLNWKTRSWTGNKKQPTGKTLSFSYTSDLSSLKNIIIKVHYEIYDGIPLIIKWLSVENRSGKEIAIGQVVNEILAVVEEESAVVGSPAKMKKPNGLYIETNYAFNNAMRYDISDQTTHWKTDPSYTSQVNYNYETPCLLEVYPENVVEVALADGQIFTSIRTGELLMDSYDGNEEASLSDECIGLLHPGQQLIPYSCIL